MWRLVQRSMLVLSLMAVCTFTNAQTISVGGTISSNTSWCADTIKVTSAVTINNGVVLTICAGSYVELQGYYDINVDGALVAVGTSTDSIHFTALDTVLGWHGIRFDQTISTNDSSLFSYCSIQYGKANGLFTVDKYGGGIYILDFSKVRISDCVFKNDSAEYGGAVYFRGTTAIIKNCLLTNNYAFLQGGAIGMYYAADVLVANNQIQNNYGQFGGAFNCQFSSPTITGNFITGNVGSSGAISFRDFYGLFQDNTVDGNSSTGAAGGGIYMWLSDATFNGNTIINNTATQDAGGIYLFNSDPIITNNLIANNSAVRYGGGLYCYGGSDPQMKNNVIVNNTAQFGGGICVRTSAPLVVNNTIANNLATDYGGALYCYNTALPISTNTIMWGNSASIDGNQVYLDDDLSDPDFVNCDIEGNTTAFGLNTGVTFTGVYQSNIDANPGFVAGSIGPGTGFNGVAANWDLGTCTPCFNTGTPDTTNLNLPASDFGNNARIFNDTIDIGAYESQASSSGYTINTSLAICPGDSVLLQGAYQTLGGNYTDSLTSVLGCDSIVVTSLALWDSAAANVTLSICAGDSVLLQGAFQTMSGTYTDSLSSVLGCDSIVITTLTVSDTVYTTLSASICEGDSLLLAGEYQNSEGEYTDTLSSATGCDSVISTVLTVFPSYNNSVPAEICSGDSIFLGGAYQANSGSYYDSLFTDNGCDSNIATVLIVNTLPEVSFSGIDTVHCIMNGLVTLVGSPSGGVFSGPGINGNVFDPGVTGLGSSIISYTYTDTNNCSDSSFQNVSVVACAGVAGFEYSGKLLAYPNPNKGQFIVEVDLLKGVSEFQLSITNVFGQVIYQDDIEQASKVFKRQISLEEYGKGIYLLHITTDRGTVEQSIVVY